MLAIVSSLLLGGFIGYICRNYKNLAKWADQPNRIVIYLLLFSLGLSVGSNQEVIDNLSNLGYQALAIALAGLGGSVVVVGVLDKLVFKSTDERSD